MSKRLPKAQASRVVASVAAWMLASCGGGGGEQSAGIDRGGVTPVPPDPIVSVGRVTGFGSVIVNATRWETTTAEILIDAMPGSEADLAVGQIVRVEGELIDDQTGTATRIVFDEVLEGPVSSIEVASGTVRVLNQLVRIDAETVFGPDLDGLVELEPGQWLRVSGLWDAQGQLRASWLDRVEAGAQVEITGRVTDLDIGASTFRINDLLIDFSAVALLDLPGGELAEELIVAVRGTLDEAADTLVAAQITLDALLGDLADGVAIEIQGIITRFADSQDFDLFGLAVTTNAETEYVSGTSADLALGVRIAVTGRLMAGGTLVAERIEFQALLELESQAGLGGLVDSVLVLTQGPLAVGQLQMLGIDVTVTDGLTTFLDSSALALRDFSVADIGVGDYLEVRGIAESGGAMGISFAGTHVERLDPQVSSRLTGVLSALGTSDFEVFGVRVQTSAETQFFDAAGSSITAEAFFEQAADRGVDCLGIFQAGVLLADEVRLKA